MSLDKLAILTSVKQRAINKLQDYKVGFFFFSVRPLSMLQKTQLTRYIKPTQLTWRVVR